MLAELNTLLEMGNSIEDRHDSDHDRHARIGLGMGISLNILSFSLIIRTFVWQYRKEKAGSTLSQTVVIGFCETGPLQPGDARMIRKRRLAWWERSFFFSGLFIVPSNLLFNLLDQVLIEAMMPKIGDSPSILPGLNLKQEVSPKILSLVVASLIEFSDTE